MQIWKKHSYWKTKRWSVCKKYPRYSLTNPKSTNTETDQRWDVNKIFKNQNQINFVSIVTKWYHSRNREIFKNFIHFMI